MKGSNLIKKAFFYPLLIGFYLTALLLMFKSPTLLGDEKAKGFIVDKKIDEFEPRNDVFKKSYPNQYQTFMKTKKGSFKTKHLGNAFKDQLKEDPMLVILWAGYGFSKDYNQGRGHYWAIKDTRNSLRTGSPTGPDDGPMPATCWTCKSPDVIRLIDKNGAEKFYSGKWAAKGHEIFNPIGCSDCHNPKTMKLRAARPALKEAFERQGKSIDKERSSEMRALVCAQCHSEYYFKGSGKYLTFPWDDGTDVAKVEKYYDNMEFKDWTHSLSKAPMIKAQHPGYEMFKMGIHGKRGLTCPDCHMQTLEGKNGTYTDHQIVSPLKNISKTCNNCHYADAEELRKNVYEYQDKNIATRLKAEKILVRAHIEAKKAWELGAKEKEMKKALTFIRHAQWRWDYAIASHGAYFHAPFEVSRILATSIEKGQAARIELAKVLAKYGFKGEVAMPDISTKAKAQKFIGLDMKKLKKDKKRFLKALIPEWDETAKARQAKWN